MLVGTVFQLVLVAVVGSTATRASCSIAFWLRHFGYCLNIGSLTVLLFRYIHFKRDATPFTRWLKRDFAQFQALAMTAVVVMVLFIFQIFVMATNADLVSEVVITPATLSNRLQIVELCSYYQSGWHIALVSLEALPVLTLFASAIQFFVNHETLEDTFYATEMWYGVLIVAGFYVLQVFELVARHFASSAIDFGFAIESLTTLIPISAELALIFERRRRIELSTTAVGAIQNHFVTLEDDDPSDELSKSGVSPSYNPDPLRLDVAQMQVIFDALSSVGQNDAGAAADSRHYHLQGSESPWLRFESGLRERFRVALRRSTAF
ncbi:hypothetical protein CAOG_09065 [Capsaspora owczarzaki ATCC 30864]|uniref:THH1/TOM1/TOM3 domain-containing protein n=1 Tax=Capsaspora owczarzaki (strain ATCC 30864) TaxID=595528 RepID=A0A0D2WX92_CAPO3|nr:hypothetical protein CAOG_09065 [Capsaspora owczarzaki ATCC 30864]KJE97368.1 hypothetical protein CAOG_009065 [Capsaspora owczarzaki ATCC 30864]|eukprot:XP_011270798.1 hypothetical protein CAOG_09065 [Capsaspora owczarzaki ATCC 30864]